MFWKKASASGQAKTKIIAATKETVELERRSDAFSIRLSISFAKPTASKTIKTGIEVIDSVMSEVTCLGVEIVLEERGAGIGRSELARNAGFAFGEGLRKLIDKRGANDSGVSIRSRGDAMAMFAISVKKQQGEANLQVIGTPPKSMQPDDFFAFFDGLAQGMGAELNTVVDFGRNGKAKTDKKKAGKNAKGMDLASKAFADSLGQIFG